MFPAIPSQLQPPLHSAPSDATPAEPCGAGVSTANPPQKIENRSDFGQKWSDSASQTPEPPEPSKRPGNSEPIWSLQPGEPAAEYQLFAAWLQLPAPRHLAKAAATLRCSLHRLRQISARHEWKTRAVAFDRHRASAASRALDQVLSDEASNWKERVERFRLQEWLLHEEMLQAATAAARQLRNHPGRGGFNDILKLYELASVLGRRACGLPLEPKPDAEPSPPPWYPDAKAALEKIYGTNNSCKTAASPEQAP